MHAISLAAASERARGMEADDDKKIGMAGDRQSEWERERRAAVGKANEATANVAIGYA